MNRHLAVITGCSSGFGLLSTVELARKGYFVVATMRDLARRGPLDLALSSSGLTERVTLRRLDVADPPSHEAFVAQTFAEYGRIDVLINNAGFALAGFAEDVLLEELRRQFETNFFGTVSLTKAVLPVMRKQGGGRILMLSSISGRSASPALSSYSSSKFALEGYTESLRLEMAPLGIDCILIEPGSFETAIWYKEENAAALALDPASPNHERTQNFFNYLQKKLRRRDPREVARLIGHVVDVPHPKLRYAIGPDARTMLVLRALLPWKVFERIVSRALKLASEKIPFARNIEPESVVQLRFQLFNFKRPMPTTASSAANLSPGELIAQRTITAYTLTPEQFRKSEGLHRTNVVLSLTSTIFGLGILAIFISARFAPKLQRVVECISRRRFVQALVCIPVLLLTLSFFELPLEIYSHHISRVYGLNVQGWGSWLADWAKGESLTVLFATLALWGLYSLIRRAPQHWWFYAWLLTLPIMAVVVFAAPIIIDPVFNRFEPLAKSNPELAVQLQRLAHSAGLEIPDSRIFLMHASEKVTTYNAYVTGFGATKRIVVWDTTARDLTGPQTLFVFGHEMGHYVLHHIYLGMTFTALLLFAGFWLIQRCAEAALIRFGERWQIRAIGDWSSLPLLMLIAFLLSFFGEPLGNSFSRWEEHKADIYGLAVTSPITKDDRQVSAQAFQLLGEKSYSYPNPSPFLVFWSYSHPPISQRIRFVLSNGSGH
jgi:STE24 endopeptidase